MISTEFSGTVAISSPHAHADIVGTPDGLCVRFASVRDLRTFSKGSNAARRILSLLPRGTVVRVEIAEREVARLGGPPVPRWTPLGILARLSGLPISGVRPLWLLGR